MVPGSKGPSTSSLLPPAPFAVPQSRMRPPHVFAHHNPLTCGGNLTRRSPFVEPHARVLDWVLAWGCTASGLGWAVGCNPSGHPKREGCSRSTPRSLPSASDGGHGTKRADTRAEHAASVESGFHIDCRLYVGILWSVWLYDHRLHPSVSATVDRNRQSTYESQHARDRGALRRHGSNAALFT